MLRSIREGRFKGWLCTRVLEKELEYFSSIWHGMIVLHNKLGQGGPLYSTRRFGSYGNAQNLISLCLTI